MTPLRRCLGLLGLCALAVVSSGCNIPALAYFLIQKMTPFSLRKEIEEDQNTSQGLILGAMIIGMTIIIAAAIQG